MTTKQAIKIIDKHNKWRRGAEGGMGNVTELGIALDLAIIVMREYLRANRYKYL